MGQENYEKKRLKTRRGRSTISKNRLGRCLSSIDDAFRQDREVGGLADAEGTGTVDRLGC